MLPSSNSRCFRAHFFWGLNRSHYFPCTQTQCVHTRTFPLPSYVCVCFLATLNQFNIIVKRDNFNRVNLLKTCLDVWVLLYFLLMLILVIVSLSILISQTLARMFIYDSAESFLEGKCFFILVYVEDSISLVWYLKPLWLLVGLCSGCFSFKGCLLFS